MGSKRQTFPCEADNDQMQAGEDQKLDQVEQHAQELEHGMLWLLLSPCASPAWAAAMASVWHFGCSCGYRYVKLDSLCFGVSHECIHRLMVCFWGGGKLCF